MEKSNVDQIHTRITAVCCRAWGISPAEFRRLESAGEIWAEDVFALLQLVSIDNVITVLTGKPIVWDWVMPEPEQVKFAKSQQAMAACFDNLLPKVVPTDEKSAEVLETIKKRVTVKVKDKV